MMEMITDKALAFLQTNPGLGLILLTGLTICGRKVWRHYSKTHRYTLKDLKKYPQEMLELVFICLVFLLGIYRFIIVGG